MVHSSNIERLDRFALLASCLQIFLATVQLIALRRFTTLFWQRHGWRHRPCGGINLVWLLVGCFTIRQQCLSPAFALAYDVVLATFGIASTLTAAHDFPHRHVSNPTGQSGTLSRHAIVTQSEMIEHSFYQGLNLCQALYLHYSATAAAIASTTTPTTQTTIALHPIVQVFAKAMSHRWLALLLVTAPWWFRRQFPVNSFSDNWKRARGAKREEVLLYKVKKAQYLFGKHVILHGLNLTVCCDAGIETPLLVYNLATSFSWRLFWICLNAAYVLEFFLQSLVKRSVISQSTMLLLNRALMVISSVAAIESVCSVVRWDLCFVSFILNLVHRGHDVFNTMMVATIVLAVSVPWR